MVRMLCRMLLVDGLVDGRAEDVDLTKRVVFEDRKRVALRGDQCANAFVPQEHAA